MMGSIDVPVKAASLPTSVTVVSAGYNALSVSWNATDTAAGYEIYRSSSATGTYTKVTETTELTYLNTGLSFNVTYYYKIQPFFIIAEVRFPGTLSAYGSAKTSLAALTNVAAASYAYNAVRTSWTAVPGATGYEVYRSTGTSTTYSLVASVATAYYVNTGLYTNTRYNYKIRPYRLVSTTRVYGSFSAIVSAIPVPSAPLNPAVVSSGYNSLKVTYLAVSGANGYEVSYSLSEAGTYSLLPLTTLTSVTLSNLATNVPVYVRIRAYRTVNYVKIYGPYSTVVYGTPIPSTPVITVVSIAYDSLKITWPAIAGASGYDIYRFNTSTSSYDLIDNQTLLTYVDDGLTAGITYSYLVKAYRTVGSTKVESKASTAVSGKPIPTTVTGFKVIMPGISFIDLNWNTVNGASGYEVQRSSSSTGTYVTVGTITDSTSFRNTGLSFNVTYYYKVRAYTLVGLTKVYGLTTAALAVRTAPSQVVLTLTNTNSKTNVLSWPAITGASGYQIYYSKGTSTYYTLLKTVTTTTYTHTALTLDATYNYKVRAYKLVGTTKIYGAYSTLKSIQVQYSAPELLGLVSTQLTTAIAKITNQAEKDILIKIKAAIDARKLNPNYDYITAANEAKVLFSALTSNQKTHLMLTIIVYVNTNHLLRLNELLPIN